MLKKSPLAERKQKGQALFACTAVLLSPQDFREKKTGLGITPTLPACACVSTVLLALASCIPALLVSLLNGITNINLFSEKTIIFVVRL